MLSIAVALPKMKLIVSIISAFLLASALASAEHPSVVSYYTTSHRYAYVKNIFAQVYLYHGNGTDFCRGAAIARVSTYM